MTKMKMSKDWDYAEKGYIVHNYKKGMVYDVDDRCVELCAKTKNGEKASGSAKTEDEKDIAKAKSDAENLAKEEKGK